MPFDERFDNIYKFGIKGAAEDVGAYAERLDEQMFNEGMLERIFNQISKADVLVADVTGRNENVFYEVGYAHALGKIVLLLTKNADDIPFDLKHRHHIVYGESIERLRKDLGGRLAWAIEEAKKRRAPVTAERFAVCAPESKIPEKGAPGERPTVSIHIGPHVASFSLPMTVRNESPTESPSVQYIYLFADSDREIVPARLIKFGPGAQGEDLDDLHPMVPSLADQSEGFAHQYRLPTDLQTLPPGASDQIVIHGRVRTGTTLASATMNLRIHTYTQVHDFPFHLIVWVA